jgi:hypothetical protein
MGDLRDLALVDRIAVRCGVQVSPETTELPLIKALLAWPGFAVQPCPTLQAGLGYCCCSPPYCR